MFKSHDKSNFLFLITKTSETIQPKNLPDNLLKHDSKIRSHKTLFDNVTCIRGCKDSIATVINTLTLGRPLSKATR